MVVIPFSVLIWNGMHELRCKRVLISDEHNVNMNEGRVDE